MSRSSSPIDNTVDAEFTLSELQAKIAQAEATLAALGSKIKDAKYEADYSISYRKGRIHCSNIRHFYKTPWDATTKTGGEFRMKPTKWILEEMVPYKAAACACERAALRTASENYQPIGTTVAEWVDVGSDHKGWGPSVQYKYKRVYPTKFVIQPTTQKWLDKYFPDYVFISVANGLHDHPAAHISTAIATADKMRSLAERGDDTHKVSVLDINGNPTANQNLMNKLPIQIETTCKVITGKDAIRQSVKWGPQEGPEGRRWHDLTSREIGAEGSSLPPAEMMKFDHAVMVHVQYYYSAEELYDILAKMKDGALLHCLVHKFEPKARNGVINNGEQTWQRDVVTNTIKQTNVVTGESYNHPDNSWLFGQSEGCSVRDGGLAWTRNMVTDDLFWITIIKTSARVNSVTAPGTSVEDILNQQNQLPPLNTTAWVKLVGSVDIANGEEVYNIPIASAKLYDDMRIRMISKPRTIDQWSSHVQMCKAKAKSVMKEEGLKSDLDADSLQRIAMASFWVDAQSQLQVDGTMFSKNLATSWSASKLYKFGGQSDKQAFVHALAEIAAHHTGRSGAAIYAVFNSLSKV